MLSLGNPTQLHFKTLRQNLQLHPKPQFLLSSTHLSFLATPGKLRNGFPSGALKTQKNRDFSSAELDDDFDDEFLDLDDDDDFVEEEDGDDDDEIVIPLKNMKKWFQSRPSGFGEGKVYDTSVEDKLMEEIEKSRIAQLANVNNLKNNPIKPGSNKPAKAPVVVPEGVQVRLVNLPKKKNIHRDLRLAFQGVPGLLNIVPVVAGNEKTRDPICKGLAFVYFKYEDEAHRFVQNFSGQLISFGKLQKKLTCEMVDPSLSKPQRDPSVNVVHNTHRLPVKRPDEQLDISLINFQDTSSLREHHDAEEKHFSAQSGDDTVSMEISSTSETIFVSEEVEAREESRSNSSPSKNEDRKAKPKKKKVAAPSNGKANSTQKLGSANRLKVRDKAMLTDVFSKYGSKSNATSTVKQASR